MAPDRSWLRIVRLGVGTGVLGGFTTYGAFVVEAMWLGADRHCLTALGYLAASLRVGFIAAYVGTAGIATLASPIPCPTDGDAMTLLLVAPAGGVGAASRFGVDNWVTARLRSALPVGAVVVNVSGSLLMGLVAGWAMRYVGGEDVQAIVGTGFLGGYTTFSTASVEAARLVRSGRSLGAAVHAGGMMVLGLAAAMIGLWITGP